jgi:hypothetical protein
MRVLAPSFVGGWSVRRVSPMHAVYGENMNHATTKQVQALRNFKVPEATIQALSFEQASAMLDELIGRARAMSNGNNKPRTPNASSEAKTTLTEATRIVLEHFGLRDKSELREAHMALIQEVSRQLYGLKYWVEKSSPRLTSQPI